MNDSQTTHFGYREVDVSAKADLVGKYFGPWRVSMT